jgi:chemotaxis response regulator CheB
MLEAMKEVQALDITGLSRLSKSEFCRLYNPIVLVAAGVKVWADAKWATLKEAAILDLKRAIEKSARKGVILEEPVLDENWGVESSVLWDIVLADDELAHIMGSENSANGKARLQAMKEEKVIDMSGDGLVDFGEFSRIHNTAVITAAGVKVKAEALWLKAKIIGSGAVDRLTCWDMIMKDDEMAYIMGKGSTSDGKAILAAMKEVKALDISGDEQIVEAEFKFVYDPFVIKAAGIKVRADLIWESTKMTRAGPAEVIRDTVEWLECWDMIMADPEIAYTMGSDNTPEGKKILLAIKEVKALDVSGEGQIEEAEFKELFSSKMIVMAHVKVLADALWAEAKKLKEGGKKGGAEIGMDRLACWDMVIGSDQLAYVMGRGDTAEGKAMLENMREVKALDVSGDGAITLEEYQRIHDISVIAAAEASRRAAQALQIERLNALDAIAAAEAASLRATHAPELKGLDAKVSTLWADMTKVAGSVERLACWDVILADDELASLVHPTDGRA